jgi:hypothetical protein
VRSGDYRVNLREGNEATAYYTDNLEDAVKTAVEMARKRGGASCTRRGECRTTPLWQRRTNVWRR